MDTFEKLGVGEFAPYLEQSCSRWGVETDADKARLYGQLFVESAGFTRLEENLNYRPERLLQIFSGRNGLAIFEQAQKICAGGPSEIGNFCYGGEWGARNLGNTELGDGYRFRGRGLIQITGRGNYADASMGCFGDMRLVNAPDRLLQKDVASDVALWFWHSRHLAGQTDIGRITKAVNGGLNGLKERIAATNRAFDILGES